MFVQVGRARGERVTTRATSQRKFPPPPRSISSEAQHALERLAARPPMPPMPQLSDLEGWRAYVRARDEQIVSGYFSRVPVPEGTRIVRREIAGVAVYDIAPPGVSSDAAEILIDIHGGGFTQLGGDACRVTGIVAALRAGVRTLSPDYRMPPDHPYPAALDDITAVYRAVLRTHAPSSLVMSGASAGGNLCAASILRLRDAGVPLPVAAVLLTPQADLTETGDTFRTLDGVDPALTDSGLTERIALYADGRNLSNPLLSPIFADFARGFPPSFLQSGTRDMFLSNTVRLHRALRRGGIEAELHIFEAMPHGAFGGTPEDAELGAEVRRFIRSRLDLPLN